MTAVRPTLATILAIWLLIVFCFGTFGLLSSTLLLASHPGLAAPPMLQLVLSALSVLLALGGAITLWQMNPISWPILIARVVVDAIALVVVLRSPLVLPANVAADPNAARFTSIAHTGGAIFGGIMLLVNLGIALYARSATTAPPAMIETAQI